MIALDVDPIRLRCAKRNAEIYGVADRITFICTDYFHFCKRQSDRVKRMGMHVKQEHENVLRSLGYVPRDEKKKKFLESFEEIEKVVENGQEVAKERSEVEKEKKNDQAEEETEDEDELGIAVGKFYHMPVFDAVFLSPPWGGPAYLDTKVTF